MDDATKEPLAKVGEMIECIDNSGCESALTIGKCYERKSDEGRESYYRVIDDSGYRELYFRKRFIRYDPKPVFGHENANFDRPSEIEEWHEGDVVECVESALFENQHRVGKLFTVNLFIRVLDAESGHGAMVTLNEIGGKHDVRYFKLVKKSPTRITPDARPYWLVKGTGPSSDEHSDEESADTEARRLAKEHRGEVFTVMGPIRSYVVSDLQCHDLSPYLKSGQGIDNGLPF